MLNLNKLKKLIQISKVMELNLRDDNVKTCIVAVSLDDGIHETNLSEALMSGYRSQSTVFMNALKCTVEFKAASNILTTEIEKSLTAL
ncbi:hypothetical protein A3K86_03645 [Photobacterium jeanii]|uniref:Uncharacterized protein n=1 Tax=Photobacterium jeanii TaxID=858640 RepID=A0A178KLZ7_9GAMM|nr:hypothetical protein [Photobacterium jeanii]OAN18025.1 hypothetical protein A3K86_03645 [Photobacterium jeanii]PST92306.1 hypothetical protein C9I91_03795 [Photobacterium jeanii]